MKYSVLTAVLFLGAGSWLELGDSASGGGISNNAAFSAWSSVAVGADGRPFVAWIDRDYNIPGSLPRVYLLRWTGQQWEELGGSASEAGLGTTTTAANRVSIQVDSSGFPIVAWTEAVPNPAALTEQYIYVCRWNGSTWEELGGSASGTGISGPGTQADHADLALDDNDQPMVSWSDRSAGPFQVYFKRWTGTQWTELDGSASRGGISQATENAFRPRLAAAPDGHPVVVWQDVNLASGIQTIYLAKWDGAAWIGLGNSNTGNGITASYQTVYVPDLAVHASGRIVVSWAWTSAGLSVMRLKEWSGSFWEELDGSASIEGVSGSWPNQTLPTSGYDSEGNAFLVWHRNDDLIDADIMIRCYNGTSWDPIQNVSASPGLSLAPQAAAASDGRITVTWHEIHADGTDIHVRRSGNASTGGGPGAAAEEKDDGFLCGAGSARDSGIRDWVLLILGGWFFAMLIRRIRRS